MILRTVTRVVLVALAALQGAGSALAYDLPYVGETQAYTAKTDDTMVHIARAHSLGFVEVRAANPYVDPWLPGEGTKMVLPSRHILPEAEHKGIVINLPEMRLYAFINGDKAPATYPLGIGREGLETPEGFTTVVRKQEGPIWRPTDRMRREDPTLPEQVLPGPLNPMGTHAMYLGWPQYAIHGTNKPYGIGRRSSSGCIRMYPEDIIALYKRIPVGTKVTVVNQPLKLAWIDDKLYLEAHPDMQQALQMEETGQVYTARMSQQDLQKITQAAGTFQDKLHWPVIREAIRNRTGVPVMIARKPGAKMDEEDISLRGEAQNTVPLPSVQKEQQAAPPVRGPQYNAGIEPASAALEPAAGGDIYGPQRPYGPIRPSL